MACEQRILGVPIAGLAKVQSISFALRSLAPLATFDPSCDSPSTLNAELLTPNFGDSSHAPIFTDDLFRRNLNPSRLRPGGSRQFNSKNTVVQASGDAVVVDVIAENKRSQKVADLVFFVEHIRGIILHLNSAEQRQPVILNL